MIVKVTGHYKIPEPTTNALVEITDPEQQDTIIAFENGNTEKAARIGYFICKQMATYRAASAALEESRDLEIKL